MVKTAKCHRNVHIWGRRNTPAAPHCGTAPHCTLQQGSVSSSRVQYQAPGFSIKLQATVTRLQATVTRLQAPVTRLQEPVSRIQYPGTSIQYPVSSIQGVLSTPRISLVGLKLTVTGCAPCTGSVASAVYGRGVPGVVYQVGTRRVVYRVLPSCLVLPGPNRCPD